MNEFPSWTQCSSPLDYYPLPTWAVALLPAGGLVALVAAALAGAWIPGVAALLATACLGGIVFCSWWLNVRLICLGGDHSAIGAIYHLEPPVASLDAFALGDYDTDYSFNLLLWPFVPADELPTSFVAEQWSASAESDLEAAWPTLAPLVPAVPYATVQGQVERIIPQQTMSALNLTFVGQDVESGDEPSPQPGGGSSQHFLLHCEIEGPGIYDLRTLLWVLFGVFVAAAIASAIPVIGSIVSLVLTILAFLAFLFGGPALQHDDASPPADGGWGGSFNPYDTAQDPDAEVDLAYVYGRWVYDSFHDGWNELHPLHFMVKLGQATQGQLGAGDWPGKLIDIQGRLDAQFAQNRTPGSAALQADPSNQWTVHPLLDGCLGAMPYPQPDPGVIE